MPPAEPWKKEEGECGPECPGDLSLVLPFLTDNPAFVNGWEAAKLHVRMEAGEPCITGYFHAGNDEQLLMMASRYGYASEYQTDPELPGWFKGTFNRPHRPPPARDGETGGPNG